MLALSLLACLTLSQSGRPQEVSVLFFGNSHTLFNDVPGLVRGLVESEGSGRRIVTNAVSGPSLNEIWRNPAAAQTLASKKWTYAVLQGAMLSSSHKYVYSQEGAIGLGQAALRQGAATRYFAEWPRRGWNETAYILGIYGQIAKQAKGSKILAIPQAFDRAIQEKPQLALWQADGNHASLAGSYLAACVIADEIGDLAKAKYVPSGLDPGLAAWLRRIAVGDPGP